VKGYNEPLSASGSGVIDESEGRHRAINFKRLERGTFRLPAAGADRLEMTTAELAALLAGIDLDKARRRARYSRPDTPPQNPEKSAPTIEHPST
jgi:transposase